MKISILTWFCMFALLSCGGADDDGSGGASGSGGTASQGGSCAALAKTWCAKACACTAGDQCTLIRPGSSETHDSETMCTNFYSVLGCQTAPTDTSWAGACQQALETAACDGQAGLMRPKACDW
ncbi:MAG: hypothetical protein U0263_08625 [Polyangiaceae bacterium]